MAILVRHAGKMGKMVKNKALRRAIRGSHGPFGVGKASKMHQSDPMLTENPETRHFFLFYHDFT